MHVTSQSMTQSMHVTSPPLTLARALQLLQLRIGSVGYCVGLSRAAVAYQARLPAPHEPPRLFASVAMFPAGTPLGSRRSRRVAKFLSASCHEAVEFARAVPTAAEFMRQFQDDPFWEIRAY